MARRQYYRSIKALQMIADSRPDFMKSVSVRQTFQAQNVARQVHMPEGRPRFCSCPLSQLVVTGVVSTAVSGSSASGSDDPAPRQFYTLTHPSRFRRASLVCSSQIRYLPAPPVTLMGVTFQTRNGKFTRIGSTSSA